MRLSRYGAFSFLILYSNILFSHPASIDYVDGRLKETQKAIDAINNRLDKNILPKHHIGELFEGGLIFYLDKTGQHGLIAALYDATPQGVTWLNGESGERTVNARANGIYAGDSNTRLIVAEQTIDYQAGEFAALMASNYSATEDGTFPCPDDSGEAICYGGWYLPSLFELSRLVKKLGANIHLERTPYWSSTEINVFEAFMLDTQTGEATPSLKSNPLGHVRAIRSF